MLTLTLHDKFRRNQLTDHTGREINSRIRPASPRMGGSASCGRACWRCARKLRMVVARGSPSAGVHEPPRAPNSYRHIAREKDFSQPVPSDWFPTRVEFADSNILALDWKFRRLRRDRISIPKGVFNISSSAPLDTGNGTVEFSRNMPVRWLFCGPQCLRSDSMPDIGSKNGPGTICS